MFKVGDVVEVCDGKDGSTIPYNVTRKGSYGKIIEILPTKNNYRVDFTHVTHTNGMRLSGTYVIRGKYLKLSLESIEPRSTKNKYYKVINKINELETKRKEMGYAY